MELQTPHSRPPLREGGAPVGARPSGSPTLAGDRVHSQDLVLGTGTLTAPGGGQAQAAAASVVDAALVGAHCGGKAGVSSSLGQQKGTSFR